MCYHRAMAISLEEVRHVARLARLELTDSEIVVFQGELNALLGHFEDIDTIDLTGVDPIAQVYAVENIWREDEVAGSLPRNDALRNAAVTRAGLFVVPTIIEG